jgi:formamidopyrimidine-DNA glycosylase
MPELPEVEHIRQGLDATLPGRRIEQVDIRWPGVLATHTPDEFASAVVGLTFGPISRRGKFLILSLPPHDLLIHLRMTGRILVSSAHLPEWETHPHVRATRYLDDGTCLYLRDLRKFGRIYLLRDAGALVGRLGPEPLSEDFALEQFVALLAGHRRLIKPLLLDQHTLAGLGNIYVDETLWLAGIHPLRRSDSLTVAEVTALYHALHTVLNAAVSHGGTTLRDYRGVDDREGEHQFALAVYGRAGLSCLRCGTPVIRIVVGQRGTHLCPACQIDSVTAEVDNVTVPI